MDELLTSVTNFLESFIRSHPSHDVTYQKHQQFRRDQLSHLVNYDYYRWKKTFFIKQNDQNGLNGLNDPNNQVDKISDLLLSLFNSLPTNFPLLYWRTPNDHSTKEILGIGLPQRVKLDPALINEIWKVAPEETIFVGPLWQFNENEERVGKNEWRSFQEMTVILPLLLFEQSDPASSRNFQITCSFNLLHPRSSAPEDFIPSLKLLHSTLSHFKGRNWIQEKSFEPIVLQNPDYLPNLQEWNQAVTQVLNSMERTPEQETEGESLEKIVLARKVIYQCSPMSTSTISSLIDKVSSRQEKSYFILISPEREQVFLSRTPEKLFYKDGLNLYTEAIAGTRPRGGNANEDEIFSQDLLQSAKDLQEHQIVVADIGQSLTKICTQVEKSLAQPGLLKLKTLQHLHTPMRGSLQKDKNIWDILEVLHPTPAIGGRPRDLAKAMIDSLEPFERGRYAAPWGWSNAQQAEFAVGIRSSLLLKEEIHLFAGCGIVKGSNPLSEWKETNDKLNNFLEMIGCGSPQQ